MAKKGRADRPKRELTKRQLSHWQTQQRRQRIVLVSGIITIVAVLAIVSIGWFNNSYRPMHMTVLKVNDASFDMQYYVDWLAIRVKTQQAQYQNLAPDIAIKDLEQYELAREEAAKLGITVSDDAVKEKIKSLSFPNNPAVWDSVKAQLLVEKIRDEYLAPKQVPASMPQANIAAMLLESEQQAAAIRARIEKGESFADLAAQFSVDARTRQQKGDLGWHPQAGFADLLGTSVPGDYAFGSDAGVLSQPREDKDVPKQLGYWLIQVDARGEGVADVKLMLLGSEQAALDAKARLAKGEDFATVAKDVSQMTNVQENGGTMAGIAQSVMPAGFDKYVFDPNTKLGVLSDPIRDEALTTRGGYWLVKVVEKADDRPLNDADLLTMKNKALDEWITSIMTDPSNRFDDTALTQELKNFALLKATAAGR